MHLFHDENYVKTPAVKYLGTKIGGFYGTKSNIYRNSEYRRFVHPGRSVSPSTVVCRFRTFFVSPIAWYAVDCVDVIYCTVVPNSNATESIPRDGCDDSSAHLTVEGEEASSRMDESPPSSPDDAGSNSKPS